MSYEWHEIRAHLLRSASTLAFQRTFDTIRRTRVPVAPFIDPTAMLDALHRDRDDPNRKNLILMALVQSAQANGPLSDCALTVLLLALWPGMDGIRRRCIGRRLGTAEELASDILAATTEAIRGLDLGRVQRIAATILRNVERDILRARHRERAMDSTSAELELDEVVCDRASHDLLDREQRADLGRLIGADAAIVIDVAIDGFSQIEVAARVGLSEAATRKRYQRASNRLRDLLRADA